MDFSVCDVYKGADLPGGKQSITFKVIMQDKETTLKESEVESVVQFITKLIKDDFGGRLRV